MITYIRLCVISAPSLNVHWLKWVNSSGIISGQEWELFQINRNKKFIVKQIIKKVSKTYGVKQIYYNTSPTYLEIEKRTKTPFTGDFKGGNVFLIFIDLSGKVMHCIFNMEEKNRWHWGSNTSMTSKTIFGQGYTKNWKLILHVYLTYFLTQICHWQNKFWLLILTRGTRGW